MERAFTNLLATHVDQTASFYQSLLGMTRTGDFGWFVVLSHPEMPNLELGILDRNHETVPEDVRQSPSGVILTFVVNNLQAVQENASDLGAYVLQGPTDMPYGQRRLLLKDPEGTVVDVSEPIL